MQFKIIGADKKLIFLSQSYSTKSAKFDPQIAWQQVLAQINLVDKSGNVNINGEEH